MSFVAPNRMRGSSDPILRSAISLICVNLRIVSSNSHALRLSIVPSWYAINTFLVKTSLLSSNRSVKVSARASSSSSDG